MTDYGSDVSTFPDLDPGFGIISGARVVTERIARRFTTPRGSLAWAPDDGVDVRAWLNDSVTTAKLTQWGRVLEQEAGKDEAILAASVAVSYRPDAMTLGVSCSLETADGPFRFVMAVTSASLTILDAR